MSTAVGGREHSRTEYIEKSQERAYMQEKIEQISPTCYKQMTLPLNVLYLTFKEHRATKNIRPHIRTSLPWWKNLKNQQTPPVHKCPCAGKSLWYWINTFRLDSGHGRKLTEEVYFKGTLLQHKEPVRTEKVLSWYPPFSICTVNKCPEVAGEMLGGEA